MTTNCSCVPCDKSLASETSLASHNKTKTHKFKIKHCNFGVDGAKTIVKDSLLLPDQKGLFAAENILKETIITWYLGINFPTYESIEERMSINEKGASYVIDVGTEKKIDYYIDGWILEDEKYSLPSAVSEAGVKSPATYINHSKKNPNVEYRYVSRNNAFKKRAVAIVALRSIKFGEELLVNYGDEYHQGLVESGLLKYGTYGDSFRLTLPCFIFVVIVGLMIVLLIIFIKMYLHHRHQNSYHHKNYHHRWNYQNLHCQDPFHPSWIRRMYRAFFLVPSSPWLEPIDQRNQRISIVQH